MARRLQTTISEKQIARTMLTFTNSMAVEPYICTEYSAYIFSVKYHQYRTIVILVRYHNT